MGVSVVWCGAAWLDSIARSGVGWPEPGREHSVAYVVWQWMLVWPGVVWCGVAWRGLGVV